MPDRKVKWGILGTGRISTEFAADLTLSDRAEILAVGGRSQNKADELAKSFGIPRAYGSIESMVNDPDVEIVYIGTLNPVHREHAAACLRAGKAVLCEKPFTINAAEAKELIQLARTNRLFLMEAMWTRYLPSIAKVREWLRVGRIGEVHLVTADYGIDGGWQPEGRLLNPELGGGALLDVGIYPVSFASMVYGGQPSVIKSSVQIGETGVDERLSLLFEYEGGRTAVLNSGVRLAMGNSASIFGTKGHIHVPNFVFGPSASLHVEDQEPVTFVDDRKAKGWLFEAEEAMSCLIEGRLESALLSLNETLDIMRTLDEVRAQWKLSYPFER